MVQCKANRPQQDIKIPKETTIEVKRLRILRITKLAVQRVKAKPKILAEEDI